MPTCPDCGSIIMEGDPYCPHCGAHLSWSDEDETQYYSNGDDLDDMLSCLFIDNSQKAVLKQKLKEFLKARDVKKLLLRESHGSYIFEFTRQNRYVKTVDECVYDPNYINPTQVFQDVYQNHILDGLEADPKFRRMIDASGMELSHIRGGYVTEYETWPRNFKMLDEIIIRVIFIVGDKNRVYRLDLENMKLSGDYSEFER